MRDKRFIAKHRGGPLEIERHRLCAKWAADCAEHVIHYFTKVSDDPRPRHAIEIARLWSKGKVTTGDCMKAAVATHAAARATKNPAAIAAARAAGHAVATAHFAEHSFGPVVYGQKAAIAAGESAEKVRAWMIKKLPAKIKVLGISALEGPRFKLKTSKSTPLSRERSERRVPTKSASLKRSLRSRLNKIGKS